MVFPCHKKMQFSLVNVFLFQGFRVMIHKKTGGAGTERFYINFVRPFGSEGSWEERKLLMRKYQAS